MQTQLQQKSCDHHLQHMTEILSKRFYNALVNSQSFYFRIREWFVNVLSGFRLETEKNRYVLMESANCDIILFGSIESLIVVYIKIVLFNRFHSRWEKIHKHDL